MEDLAVFLYPLDEKMADWKASIDRKHNCMTLFKLLQELFNDALSDQDIVTASEDIEFKLMISHEMQEDFKKDLARVYSQFRRST